MFGGTCGQYTIYFVGVAYTTKLLGPHIILDKAVMKKNHQVSLNHQIPLFCRVDLKELSPATNILFINKAAARPINHPNELH
jgi:hypothetical protein